jgi:hypothetical protein
MNRKIKRGHCGYGKRSPLGRLRSENECNKWAVGFYKFEANKRNEGKVKTIYFRFCPYHKQAQLQLANEFNRRQGDQSKEERKYAILGDE